MELPIRRPFEPMLARLEHSIPRGEGWLFEPKWDGFRALVFRGADGLQLFSRNGQELDRYFPELLAALELAVPNPSIVDGEIILEREGKLDFDALLQRIHPAPSRVARLARETPASFVAFDLVALGEQDLRTLPFAERRRRLLEAMDKVNSHGSRVFVTPQTDSARVAEHWMKLFEGHGLDGLVAKRFDGHYLAGERAMVKVKRSRTVDCVIGGYRLTKQGDGVASLLLGLYERGGLLVHVGHSSGFNAAKRRELLELLRPEEAESSFAEGRTPGGPSRWNRGREAQWVPVAPRRVCEVAYDKMQGDRFRHAVRFLRMRPDRRPAECTFRQVEPAEPMASAEYPWHAGV